MGICVYNEKELEDMLYNEEDLRARNIGLSMDENGVLWVNQTRTKDDKEICHNITCNGDIVNKVIYYYCSIEEKEEQKTR